MLKNISQNPRFTKKLVSEKVFADAPVVIMDVGAANGFGQHLKIFDDQAVFIGFEPHEESFEKLNTKGGVRYYNVALGKTSEIKRFYVAKWPYASSSFKVNEGFYKRFPNLPYHETIEEIEQNVISLDEFADQNNISEIDFIKLDTEGTELEILQGGYNLLKGLLGVDVEVAFQQYHLDRPVFRDIDLYMNKHQFTLYDLDCYRHARRTLPSLKQPIVMPSEHGQVMWGQALYMKDLAGNRNNAHLVSVSKILKVACFFEIFEHYDSAIEIMLWALHHRILDQKWEAYVDLLVPAKYGEMSLRDYKDKASKVKQFRI